MTYFSKLLLAGALMNTNTSLQLGNLGYATLLDLIIFLFKAGLSS